MISRPTHFGRCFLLFGILLGAFAVANAQNEVRMKNTIREIRAGLYECVIYFEMDKDESKTIDDVTYTLPVGYRNRKQKAKRVRPGINGYFSSRPIVTAEEIIVNVKIDYDDAKDVFLSYKINPFPSKFK